MLAAGAARTLELLELGEAAALELSPEVVDVADDGAALVERVLGVVVLEAVLLVAEESSVSVLLDELLLDEEDEDEDEDDAHGIFAEARRRPFAS